MLYLYGVFSYLLGAIPVAYIYCKLKGVDIRKHGSGNVGATNASRIFGRKAFVIVTLFDVLKGFVPVYFSFHVGKLYLPAEMLFFFAVINLMLAVLGHMFPVFLNFKGGKGVNTSIGGIMAVFPLSGCLTLLMFGIVFRLSRIVSLSSIMAALSFPGFLYLTGKNSQEVLFGIVLGIVIIVAHKNNIVRLLKGEEASFRSAK